MSDQQVTSAEKTKNPKRVEQGKRLAAISRELRERKKQEQEKFIKSAEDDGNKVFFVIGLIGAAFLVYKVFSEPSEASDPSNPPEAERPSEPPEAERHSDSFAPRRKRSYEPYTMD